MQRLLPEGVETVLEAGCGQAGVGTRLAARYDYLGVEPDPVSAATARHRLRGLGRGELREGLPDDVLEPGRTFDLVCAFEVMEHLEDDRGALAGWSARLRPGGWLMLSVPAFQERFGPSDEMAGHFRRYSPGQVTALLESEGLVDVQVVVYGVPLGYVLEAARHRIGARRLARAGAADASAERVGELRTELTSGSGRLLQPPPALATLVRAGTAPFRVWQRRFPERGTGLVVRARRPAQGES